MLKRRSFLPVTAATTGLALVVVSVVLLLHDRSLPADFGQIPNAGPAVVAADMGRVAPPQPPDQAAQTAASTTPVATVGRPSTANAPDTGVPAVDVSTAPVNRGSAVRAAATATATAAAEPFLPSRLSIAALGVTTSIQFVSSREGALQVPENPAQVGWWLGSVLPGSSSGTTVIDGHIDSAVAGVGAFWHLSTLASGAVVIVTGLAGQSVRYRVAARRVFVKNVGLPPTLFTRTGSPTLLLISCGGPFDANRGSYEDNIVVFAVPTA